MDGEIAGGIGHTTRRSVTARSPGASKDLFDFLLRLTRHEAITRALTKWRVAGDVSDVINAISSRGHDTSHLRVGSPSGTDKAPT